MSRETFRGARDRDATAYLCLWLFAFTVPWQNIIILPGLGTIAKTAGLLVPIMFLILRLLRADASIRPLGISFALLLAFATVGILSYLWSSDPSRTLTVILTFLPLCSLSWLVYELSDSEVRRRGLMQAYIVGSLVAMAYVGWTLLTSLTQRYRSMPAEFNPNAFAVSCVLALPMAWRCAEWSWREKRLPLALANFCYIPLVVLAVILSASRTALVVMIGTVGVLLLSGERRAMPYRFLAAGIEGLATAALYVVFSRMIALAWNVARLATTVGEIRSGSLNWRRVIWDAGFQVFRDHPYFGVGLGGFQREVSYILGRVFAPHNVYLSYLVDLGLAGFALYASFVGSIILALLTDHQSGRSAYLALFVGLMLSFAASNMEVQKATWLIFGMTMSRACRRREVSVPVLAI